MSGDPISANGGLIVRSNGGVAGLRVAKNDPLDPPYAPKRKTPPSAAVGSAAVGVEWIPDQPPHPKPKAHSPIQGESEVERPQAAR